MFLALKNSISRKGFLLFGGVIYYVHPQLKAADAAGWQMEGKGMQEYGGSFFEVKGDVLTLGNSLFRYDIAGVESAQARLCSAGGLSAPYMEVTARVQGETRRYGVWADMAVLWMESYRGEKLPALKSEHYTIRTVKLNAFTDDNDTLTEETFVSTVNQKLGRDRHGEIFYLEDALSGEAMVLIAEMPDFATATLSLRDNQLHIDNSGCGLAIGFCRAGECERLSRAYYRHVCVRKELVTMSNTWGDRHGFSRVCEEFVLREIEAGQQIGVDIVQIDDGWQTGSTADKTRRDAQGRREFYGDFWDLNTERFPGGMRRVADAAKACGLRLGLWFAPESHGQFALMERDLSVLKKAYDEWGVRFFKLDMFFIENLTELQRFRALLSGIYAFGDDVAVQLDVTRDARVNYFGCREFGTIFVENRYTRSGNAFPHRVLRNLWMIGQYLPTNKFQFELINPDLNGEYYAPDDDFAPAKYEMDYLFATVMLSNPLLWMEMQFLAPKRREELQRVMPVWKQHRQALAGADVQPIGERPSGRSLTGFRIRPAQGAEYLLVFREATQRETAVFALPGCGGQVQVLASNAQVQAQAKDGVVQVTLSKPRAYALIQIL